MIVAMTKACRRAWQLAFKLSEDRRGVAAIEFAMIVPIMLVLFCGTVEFSSAVATDRKITIAARALSDLTSQSLANPSTLVNADLTNIFTASIAILYPYPATPVKAQLWEIYVDSNKKAVIQWSESATVGSGATQATIGPPPPLSVAGTVVTSLVPAALLVPQTYLIYSRIDYTYTPIIGYGWMTSIPLSDVEFTRPRLGVCILFNSIPAGCPLT
jgi:Flp pilus assembly protein TadG